jgi:2-amino-4-hydroxy-6-hydroxymethyldihydropteridine diphosphokinase
LESTAFLGLGSNKGERKIYLQDAILLISKHNVVLAESSIYQTPPWGYLAQQPFLNQVIKISTTLSPQDLLLLCKQIEVEIGRTPTFRYGPRKIDVDILSYGDLLVDEENLIIPHPELHNRAFMLVPLQEIDPNYHHPKLNISVSKMLDGQNLQEIKILVNQN